MIMRRCGKTSRNLIVVVTLTLTVAAGGLYLLQPRPDTESSNRLADATAALERNDLAAAEKLARQAIAANEQPAVPANET